MIMNANFPCKFTKKLKKELKYLKRRFFLSIGMKWTLIIDTHKWTSFISTRKDQGEIFHVLRDL